MHTFSFQGHPCSLAHCKSTKCPLLAAEVHTFSFQGHPCSLAHCNTSKCPPSAAAAQVFSFQGHPISRNICSIHKRPLTAAMSQLSEFKVGEVFAKSSKQRHVQLNGFLSALSNSPTTLDHSSSGKPKGASGRSSPLGLFPPRTFSSSSPLLSLFLDSMLC